MGRRKSPEEELEQLKQKNKELYKTINQLKSQIRQLKKYKQEKTKEEKPKRIKQKKCPDCGKGTITKVEVLGRIFETCDICEYRNKL